ncbi:MAG: efflux RND transporter periplasmic adaptor subunit [Tepidimonas sp.]|uniref:efflux RND transporter periplasmic adaptor subunit n=1 Tax=Tepidimonas sp. TaxID=2002775 RepID=UPI00405509A3
MCATSVAPSSPAPDHRLTLDRRTALTSATAWLVLATLTPPSAWAADGPRIDVYTVARQPVGQVLTLDGTLQAVQQSTLSAQASGRVVQLAVKAGDRVRAGQVLAVIDDRETTAGAQRAQASVAQAEAEARNAEAHLQRTRELRAQGFVSQAALDTAQAQADAARAAVAQARAAQTQSALAQGFTRLTAPYDGYVLATHAERGDLAAPGRAILTIYAPQPLRATVQVPASRAPLAAAARRVEVLLPDGRWVQPSRQTQLPSVDPVSQTIEWRLDLAPADAAAHVPGQSVKVRFVAGTEERLVVPARALLRRGELTAVYVAAPAGAPNGFVLRAVRVGVDHGEAGVEVLSGVQAGDRVALDPVRAGLAGAQPAQR